MPARYGTRWFARPDWSRIGAVPIWPGSANSDGLRLPIEDVTSDLLELAPDGRVWSEGACSRGLQQAHRVAGCALRGVRHRDRAEAVPSGDGRSLMSIGPPARLQPTDSSQVRGGTTGTFGGPQP
jgi:hypothetical protein